jgi:hypothetical protein
MGVSFNFILISFNCFKAPMSFGLGLRQETGVGVRRDMGIWGQASKDMGSGFQDVILDQKNILSAISSEDKMIESTG